MKKIITVASIAAALSSPLSGDIKVLALSGSTRADSYNKKLLNEAVEMAQKKGAKVTVIDLKDFPMPFYDHDLEKTEGMPKNAKKFRDLMIQNDAIIIASPEYNSSISAVLKNALDWASRSEEGGSSRAAFKGKKFAIMSASPGKSGGKRGLVHLKHVIEDVGGVVVPTQVSISSAHQYFQEKQRAEHLELKQEIDELLGKS
jgi:NAD(P)H-dependent FMN reductase